MAASNGSDSTGSGITLENIINVEAELKRVKKLQDSNAHVTQEVVSSITSSIEEAKNELKGGTPTSTVLESLRKVLSDAGHREKAGAMQKAYHAGLGKLIKTTDKVCSLFCLPCLFLRVLEVRVSDGGRGFVRCFVLGMGMSVDIPPPPHTHTQTCICCPLTCK